MPRRKIDADWLREHYPKAADMGELIDDFEREFGWRPAECSLYNRAYNLGLHKESVGRRVDRVERPMLWRKEPEMKAWMLEHDHGQKVDTLREKFRERWSFDLSRRQVHRFRMAHGTQVSKVHAPVGTESVDSHGHVTVKVADGHGASARENWRPKHILVYEQAHGKVPEGHRVVFADGNKANFAPDNLVAIPMRITGVMASLKPGGLMWHDAETLETAVAIAELHIERKRIERERPRTCPNCGRTFNNAGRSKSTARTCPECVAAGHRIR